jgi:hypothetical protein
MVSRDLRNILVRTVCETYTDFVNLNLDELKLSARCELRACLILVSSETSAAVLRGCGLFS